MKDTKLTTEDLNLISEQYGQMYTAPIEEKEEQLELPGAEGEEVTSAIKQRAAATKDPEIAFKLMYALGNKLLEDSTSRQMMMRILGEAMPGLSEDDLRGAAGQLIAAVPVLKQYDMRQREERMKAQQIASDAQSLPRGNPHVPDSDEDLAPEQLP